MKLPNGWQVSAKAEMEGLFIYNEIFREDCYGKHGIRIADGDTVVDVGANVGQHSCCSAQLFFSTLEGICMSYACQSGVLFELVS